MITVLEKLKNARQALSTVELAEGVSVGLRLLTDKDYMQAGTAAISAMRQRGEAEVNLANADLYESEKTAQILALAVVDKDSGLRVFRSAEEFSDSVTREQKSALVMAYIEHEKNYAPKPENIGVEAFAELLETLKKTPEAVNLNGLSSVTLRRLITTLVGPPLR